MYFGKLHGKVKLKSQFNLDPQKEKGHLVIVQPAKDHVYRDIIFYDPGTNPGVVGSTQNPSLAQTNTSANAVFSFTFTAALSFRKQWRYRHGIRNLTTPAIVPGQRCSMSRILSMLSTRRLVRCRLSRLSTDINLSNLGAPDPSKRHYPLSF